MKDYTLARAQLAPEAELATLGVDSLGLIELMFRIEDRFAISLPDDKPPVMVTIGDVVAYIEQLKSAVPGASLACATNSVDPAG